jgi:hypothetical protein
MKFLRIPALVAITALVVVSCNRDGDAAGQSANNVLLDYVPADTPYLFANIEPTPPEVIDSFMLRMAPSLLMAQTLLSDFKLEINTDDPGEHKEARLLSALLAEFDGNMSREGLEKLGLSLDSHKVIYGMGMFPVIRVALKDPAALRAAIGRVESASGMNFDNLTSGESDYWRITGNGNDQAGAYIAILDDHVAFSMFPLSAEAEWLPAFLGQSKPADSGAAAKALASLNKDKGYTNYGSGFIDLQKIADQFINPQSKTAALFSSMGNYTPQDFSEVCINEVKGLISKAPRLVGGTTELSTQAIGISYQLELESGLAAKLVDLVAQVPVADSDPSRLFSASLGLRIGRVRNFVMEQVNAVIESPFQCKELQHINAQAKAALDQFNLPIMPFINNLNGFRVSMDEVDFENFSPEKAKGLFSLEVDKPQMLIGTAQMFVPGMENLELEPGADPVEIPTELASFAGNGLNLYAAMSKDAIGIASGENRQSELSAFMEADADNGNIFFSVEYDMGAQIELSRQIQAKAYSSHEGDSDAQDFQDLMKSIQDSYLSWMGRSRLELSFTEDGLQIDTRMTFK